MSLDLASIPLALLAGVVGILSPCVWPLVPVIMSSAATSGRSGQVFLALGLAVSFAVAGTFLTLLLLNLGLDPDGFRVVAAVLLLLIGAALFWPVLGDRISQGLSRLTASVGCNPTGHQGPAGQVGVGALLDLVWLPCVGPTLGAAIALASLGQDMAMAFVVMLTFGIGTAATLLAAALVSGSVLSRWRPGLMAGAVRGKQILGALLLLLGIMVLTGFDKVLETWALTILPDWATSI